MSCADLSWEEIDKYKDFDVTSAPLHAVADHLGQACKDANDRFMLCRIDNNADPRKCLREGQVVTNCTKSFFSDVYKTCKDPLTRYVTCLDNNLLRYDFCRETQIEFDKCMLEKMNLARKWTYFMDKKPPHRQTWAESGREFLSDAANVLRH